MCGLSVTNDGQTKVQLTLIFHNCGITGKHKYIKLTQKLLGFLCKTELGSKGRESDFWLQWTSFNILRALQGLATLALPSNCWGASIKRRGDIPHCSFPKCALKRSGSQWKPPHLWEGSRPLWQAQAPTMQGRGKCSLFLYDMTHRISSHSLPQNLDLLRATANTSFRKIPDPHTGVVCLLQGNSPPLCSPLCRRTHNSTESRQRW